MRAFITWAHRGEGWSPDQAERWKANVVRFASQLHAAGVDVVIDQWMAANRDTDWTRWGPNQVDECDFVLIAMNFAWAERWKGKNSPGIGAGVVAEADALHGLFRTDQSVFQQKVRIVLLPGTEDRDIPNDLRRLKSFTVTEITESGIAEILGDLTELPARPEPAAGAAVRTGDLLLLRFRDLARPTISSHRTILEANPEGYVWWGWWKRFTEDPRVALWVEFEKMARSGEARVALFDSGSPSGDVRRATVSLILPPRLNTFGDSMAFLPEPAERQHIPEYYRTNDARESFSRAWLQITSIEDGPCAFYNRYQIITPGSIDHGVVIRSSDQLASQGVTLWHIRSVAR